MPKKYDAIFFLKVLAIILLVALPFLAPAIYRSVTSPNPEVVFAGGLQGGRYDEFTKSLVNELNQTSQLNKAKSIQSGGSYENLDLLESRKVDFALFQSGSDQKEDLDDDHDDVVFVSNVFPEAAHLLVRSDIEQSRIDQMDFRKIAVGVPTSGDYRAGIALLSHFNLIRDEVQISPRSYVQIVDAFKSKKIELAILNVGVGAEVLQELVDSAKYQLIAVPSCDAFLAKHVGYSEFTIPAGTYFSEGKQIPAEDLKTVAVSAQLLTHREVPSAVVGEVLRTLNQSKFLKANRLRNLFVDGKAYALKQPEFSLHVGAQRYYNPNFRPWINPDFVEATEGIRSFVFSGLIGLYLLFRWIRIRNERSQAHKLDGFIHRLLAIEQEQLSLDRDYSEKEILQMEHSLDEITSIRRQALLEFTAHELNDDPAIECFITMSNALTEKINSKLTRDVIRKNGAICFAQTNLEQKKRPPS